METEKSIFPNFLAWWQWQRNSKLFENYLFLLVMWILFLSTLYIYQSPKSKINKTLEWNHFWQFLSIWPNASQTSSIDIGYWFYHKYCANRIIDVRHNSEYKTFYGLSMKIFWFIDEWWSACLLSNGNGWILIRLELQMVFIALNTGQSLKVLSMEA